MMELPAEARCRGCGYSLQCLEATRCPECGRDFDPAAADTYRVKDVWEDRWDRFDREWHAPTQVDALVLWAITAVTLAIVELWVSSRSGVFNLYPCWAVPPLAVAWFVRRRVRRARLAGHPEPYQLSERAFNGAYWVLCVLLLTVFSFHRSGGCGHGDRHGFGPVGWGYSTIGSPCNSPGIRYWRLGDSWYVWYKASE